MKSGDSSRLARKFGRGFTCCSRWCGAILPPMGSRKVAALGGKRTRQTAAIKKRRRQGPTGQKGSSNPFDVVQLKRCSWRTVQELVGNRSMGDPGRGIMVANYAPGTVRPPSFRCRPVGLVVAARCSPRWGGRPAGGCLEQIDLNIRCWTTMFTSTCRS